MLCDIMFFYNLLIVYALPWFIPVHPNLLLEVSHTLVRRDTASVDDLAQALDRSFDQVAAAVVWLAKFNLLQISVVEETG